VSAIASTPQTEFSWFRYGQYNETGIYISIEKTIIITITVSGGCFKKEYSIVSHMLVTDTITEATLYENGLCRLIMPDLCPGILARGIF
ncbi:hypothetical protein MLY71_22820, partial [Escherichia coli]|nr:hypothetical protein [Escherichia coli]